MSFSIQAVYNWYRNTLRNPKYRWWIILGTMLYLLSPIDIAPDFLPIVGELDDIALVTLLVSEVSQLLVDYFKSRQGTESAQVSSTVNDGATPTGGTTVDVEAASVK